MLEFLIDRHERLALHLVVEVAQVGCRVAVEDDAVARQFHGIGDAQPAAHQNDGDQPELRMVPLVEVVVTFELSHHQLAQRPGQALSRCEIVLEKHDRGRGQAGVPAVPADRGEEEVQLTDPAPMHAPVLRPSA
ncbi:hypothetical protein ABZU75_37585 [Streptosporangium sp. NPDC005286]|uniref:hypothetical protein n=1 Tax=Streptosporangium sp. NPDC005286 TaxID=3154463 RepID=UPI0033B2D6A2